MQKDKFEHIEDQARQKLKFQIRTNTLVFISVLLLALIVGLALAFLK